jgi:hypothetical protein
VEYKKGRKTKWLMPFIEWNTNYLLYLPVLLFQYG